MFESGWMWSEEVESDPNILEVIGGGAATGRRIGSVAEARGRISLANGLTGHLTERQGVIW